MSKNLPLGGQRLGTGNKISVNLHGYDRANFNLSKIFRSSIAPGTLVPCYCNIATNGDTFDINLRHLIKTLPTNGPLFGSFKMQIDFFQIPIRLYNGLLHNNKIGIGMNMENVKFPVFEINQMTGTNLFKNEEAWEQINPSSLVAYLGVRGIGNLKEWKEYNGMNVNRTFNAIPLLGYYDIFKNYYSNKQEENFYVIQADESKINGNIEYGIADYVQKAFKVNENNEVTETQTVNYEGTDFDKDANDGNSIDFSFDYADINTIMESWQGWSGMTQSIGFDLQFENYAERTMFEADKDNYLLRFYNNDTNQVYWVPLTKNFDLSAKNNIVRVVHFQKVGTIPTTNWTNRVVITDVNYNILPYGNYSITKFTTNSKGTNRNVTSLKSVELSQLDEIREELLKTTEGQTQNVNKIMNTLVMGATSRDFFPWISRKTDLGMNYNAYPQNGLVVKTYLSDIFNNWLNTETIEGANGISQITKVSTADGGFTIDALNLAQKVYNLLNRIAVSGGTYDDWQEVVWDTKTIRKAETPIYLGGTSAEIMFDEVVSTADTTGTQAGEQPLGSLAGKGYTSNKKGGKIIVKIKEPSFIMGILSITPRIDYSQGNKFYMTDLESLDDLHKPALDGIGFQDLMQEKMNATGTLLEHKGAGQVGVKTEQYAIGKQPAWIDWQTDNNECFGDFAIPNKAQYMTLTRTFKTDDSGKIVDATTYIDPVKYNYAFADTAPEAQNFWAQVAIDVFARRKMSAKIIPTM